MTKSQHLLMLIISHQCLLPGLYTFPYFQFLIIKKKIFCTWTKRQIKPPRQLFHTFLLPQTFNTSSPVSSGSELLTLLSHSTENTEALGSLAQISTHPGPDHVDTGSTPPLSMLSAAELEEGSSHQPRTKLQRLSTLPRHSPDMHPRQRREWQCLSHSRSLLWFFCLLQQNAPKSLSSLACPDNLPTLTYSGMVSPSPLLTLSRL